MKNSLLTLLLLIPLFISSCKEEADDPLAVTTLDVEDISTNFAYVSFKAENFTGCPTGTTNRPSGIAWDTSTSPTVDDNKELGAQCQGGGNIKVDGLTSGTTYYVRAFVTNVDGSVVYGNELSFTTL